MTRAQQRSAREARQAAAELEQFRAAGWQILTPEEGRAAELHSRTHRFVDLTNAPDWPPKKCTNVHR